jgi:hypothetical protein
MPELPALIAEWGASCVAEYERALDRALDYLDVSRWMDGWRRAGRALNITPKVVALKRSEVGHALAGAPGRAKLAACRVAARRRWQAKAYPTD